MNNEKLSAAGKSKRANLRKMVVGTAYAVPVIAAFHVGDMATNEANAYTGGSCGGNPGNDKCVGGAGETPGLGEYGSGSQGTSN